MSFFGVPFFAAGVFVCLMAVGVVVPDNADELPWWAWPVMLAMGLTFVTVGGYLVFGRRWIGIDRSRGTVLKEWGLLVPLRVEELSLTQFAAVVLTFDAGDSDSPDRYPISLKAQTGASDLRLLSGTTYAGGRATAERISAILRLPLIDSTTDHESVHRVDMIAAPLKERAAEHPPATVPRPVTLRSHVEQSARSVRLTIPGPGFRSIHLVRLAIPIGIAGFVAAQLSPFFRDSGTPEPVRWFFLGFMALFAVAPSLSGLLSIIRAVRSRTLVSASPAGVTIEARGAMKTTTTEIPAGEILDIDFGTTGSRMESAGRMTVVMRSGNLAGGPGEAWRTGEIPRWAAVLHSLVPSTGVILKTRKGVFTFGGGLPDDEVKYLHEQVRRAVLE